jgi:hypothetical protein
MPDETSNHVFRNFGEDLWRLTQEDRRWDVNIGEVDRANHAFEVVVRSSMLKRALDDIRRLLSEHHLREKVRIDLLEED